MGSRYAATNYLTLLQCNKFQSGKESEGRASLITTTLIPSISIIFDAGQAVGYKESDKNCKTFPWPYRKSSFKSLPFQNFSPFPCSYMYTRHEKCKTMSTNDGRSSIPFQCTTEVV